MNLEWTLLSLYYIDFGERNILLSLIFYKESNNSC